MDDRGVGRGRILAAVLLVGGALVLTRLRGGIEPWAALHTAMAERGVPEPVRLLDAPLVQLAAALLAARLALGSGRVADALALRGSLGQGLWFGVVAAVPMLAVAVFAPRDVLPDGLAMACAVAVAFVHEAVRRGALVALPVRFAGWPFWPTAIAVAVLVQALQLPWEERIVATDVRASAVAAAIDVWFAWLLRAFAWSLWPAVVLHAAMSAGWIAVAVGAGGSSGGDDGGSSDDGLGGVAANVGRGLTIALATALALRHRRHRCRERRLAPRDGGS